MEAGLSMIEMLLAEQSPFFKMKISEETLDDDEKLSPTFWGDLHTNT